MEVYSDSQVVVGQMNDEYAINSENLKDYATTARKLTTKFRNFQLKKVSRNENTEANRLAKIASGDEVGDGAIEV